MKMILIVVVCFLILVITYFFILGIQSRSGNAPGLSNGKLTRCSEKPNCVCSEFKADSEHFVEPIFFQNVPVIGIEAIKNIVIEMGGVVENEGDQYLSAKFRSGLFGFVDDFEIRIDSDQKNIQVRSASRVGHSDLGANLNRVNQFKSRLPSGDNTD
jgi:uncharacterized protein (DUF1499 family)